MKKGNFILDLIMNPLEAINTIKKKWSLPKTVAIFVLTFFMLSVNFFLVGFAGNVLPFFFTYGMAFGIILESMLLLLNLLLLSLLLRATHWKGKMRAFTKTASWLIMVPALVYYLITLPIIAVLRLILQEGFAVYLYRTAKYIMYLWIISLLTFAVAKDHKETRISQIATVLLAFTLTYIMVVAMNYNLVSLIQSRIEV